MAADTPILRVGALNHYYGGSHIPRGLSSDRALDQAPLDTLVLATPISWKGTLAQYAGRLHREHSSKSSVRIVDFVLVD